MPVTLDAIEVAVKDVAEQLQAMPKSLTSDEILTLVKSNLPLILADPEVSRKMRFESEQPAKLRGTKYARHRLSVGDVEFLHDIMTSVQGQRTSRGFHPGPSDELKACFGAISSAKYLSEDEVKAIDRKAIEELYPRVSKIEAKQLDAAIKAMDSAESGYGSQLVGAQYVGDLWEAARMESRIFSLIDTFEMTAPTAYLPVEADIPEMLFVAENTANNSSDYDTSKTGSQRVQVDAKKFLIHQIFSGEMEEDSIIPFIPYLRRQAMLSLAHYSDSLVLNGDDTNSGTGNINLDDANPADSKHYLAFNAIRHAALVDNTGNASDAAGAVTYALLRKLPRLMIDTTRLFNWGMPTDPLDLVYISDPGTAIEVGNLPELLTMDKFGNFATVFTGFNGVAARIGMHPLISSMAMSKTEADGKVSTTDSNNTKGQVACFNRRGFKAGWRRRVRLETEPLPGRDQTRLVYSLRMGFGRYSPTGAASGIESTATLYNITLP